MFSSLLQTVVAVPLAPLGRRRLGELLANGVPEYLSAPMRFLLGERLVQSDFEAVEEVELIRSKFLDAAQVKRMLDAPLDLDGKRLQVNYASVEFKKLVSGWTARISSVPKYWGTLLYLLASARQAKTILELGSCIGISGSYLSSAKYCRSFITVEQSQVLAALAKMNLSQVTQNALVRNSMFDEALDEILPALRTGLDMVYVDGHHEKFPTLHYLDRLTPHLSEGSLLVFDDIHWSKDMDEAWQIIIRRPGLSFTVDLGRFGVGIWNGQAGGAKNYDLSLYTRWWQSGVATFPEKM